MRPPNHRGRQNNVALAVRAAKRLPKTLAQSQSTTKAFFRAPADAAKYFQPKKPPAFAPTVIPISLTSTGFYR
jgi:hypothetical protein